MVNVAWLVFAWERDPQGGIEADRRQTADGIADLLYPDEVVRLRFAGRSGLNRGRWDVYRQREVCRVWAPDRPRAELEARRIVGGDWYAAVQSVASWEAGQTGPRFPRDGTDYDGA